MMRLKSDRSFASLNPCSPLECFDRGGFLVKALDKLSLVFFQLYSQTDTSASVRKLLVKIIDQVIRELPESAWHRFRAVYGSTL